MAGEHAARLHRAPVEVASAVLAAIADGRVQDVVDLVDPKVIWVPSIRPGRSMYDGRRGVAQFVADLHAAYGRFRIVVDDLTARPDPSGEAEVTARIGGFRQLGGEELALPSLTVVFIVREGLVTVMESTIEDPPPYRG